MNQELNILQLYPDELNIYGDNGNLLALKRRLEWRGIIPNLISHQIGNDISQYQPDIILAGGGQDSNQIAISEDLKRITEQLKSWIEAGVPSLMICGAFQILGQPYQNLSGQTIPGMQILDLKTVAKSNRLTGNIVVFSPEFGEIVGYENHSGQTYLGLDLQPLGQVIKGIGNNNSDKTEGLRYKNLIGSYLHGPILPKNPRLADFLIKTALKRKYGADVSLEPLDDSIELAAQRQALKRPR